MSKKGLPLGIAMRHDSHYVEELSKPNKSVGKFISINLLEPNPEQPRVEIGDLEELSQSIKEKGILEPILVRPNSSSGNYMIIAGERRWRAANLAGLREIPCIELDLDEQSIAEIALIENLQRKDLTTWEEADGLAALKERFGYKHEDIAQGISKSRSTVTELLSVASIPPEVRAKCRALNLNSKSVLLEVARQFDEQAMHDHLDNYRKRDKSQDKNHNKNQLSSFVNYPAEKIKADVPAVESTAGTGSDSAPKSQPIVSKDLFVSGLDSAVNPAASAPANIFSYHSKNQEFSLEITFNNLAAYDKKNILRALKESFDDIKSI